MKTNIQKKTAIAAMCIFSILFSITANAQKDEKKFSFGFALEGGPVIGDKDIKDVFSAGFGITARGSYKLGPGFATLSTGAVIFFPEDIEDEDLKVGLQIPVKIGYKYIFLDRYFIHGEVGYSSYSIGFASDDDEVVRESTGGFTFAPTVGATFGVFEVGVKYENIVGLKFDGGSKFSTSTVGLRVGFNF